MENTLNYSFVTSTLGHPVRDTRVGDNLTLIDTAIKAREDSIDAIETAMDAVPEIVTIPLSFETNELTATKVYFPVAVTITKIRSIVMLALAATNAGTITGANSVGDSTNGVVTVAAEAALNEEDSAIPTTNKAVAKDSYYMLTTAKANAGGKVLVTLEYTQSI